MARGSLREFQEHLARRLAESMTAERRGLLGFQCGNENWVIELAEAGEILPPPALAEVPLTRLWYRGLANVRGTLYSVVDLAQFCGQPPIVAAGRARLLLVGARLGIHCALLVSASSGLRSHEDFETDPNADGRPWVARRLRDLQGRIWHQLDVARLLAHPDFLDAGLH
ncbi:chemotaxis protein CheW [Thauera sp.]|uniref:chemotaxis protein CheW n=1 Tax=Thauera sp. TaxID=1905334 RepID=UPI002589F6C5|nr:chemotaxis protein CheW [Thauera sp.]HRK10551.1 chemotaxis protein CheW [Thauera sp.]